MAGTINPIVRVIYNGAIYASARVHIYQSGTTTPITTYTDGAMTSANANPAITNSNGEITVYAPTTNALRFLIKTSDDVTTIADIDPVYPTPILTGLTASVSQLNILDSTAATSISVSGTTIVIKSTSGVKLNSNQPIVDSSGNELITFTSTTSAVNQIDIANAATTGAPIISPKGDDTNIGITMKGKGTGTATIGQSTAPTTITGNTTTINGTTTTISGTTINIGADSFPTSDGSAYQHLVTNGAGALSFVGPSMRFANAQTFSASGTFNIPSNVNRVFIRQWGAGGGGGGTASSAQAVGTGGGGGAYLEKLASVTPGGAITVTIGTVGTAGANTGGNGGTGGNTTCSGGGLASTLTASGGTGGTGSTSASNVTTVGAGGAATNGDLNISGQNGGFAITGSFSGLGGSSPQGGGGGPAIINAAGNAGATPGGGGGGSYGAGVAGGVGGAGYCIIYY